MLQGGQPVAFASRGLIDSETRWAQIEKELLSIVFGLERFNQYTYGRHVYIESDHKPLESIMKKPLYMAPRRLQALLLRLQKYDVTVVYKKGSEMYIADTLSRAFLPNEKNQQVDLEQVHMVKYLLVTKHRLGEIRQATDSDETLQQLMLIIKHGWPDKKSDVPDCMHMYYTYRDELSIHDGLIFRGERLFVPLDQRSIVKRNIHSSHMGMEACMRRAREAVFWPGMNTEMKEYMSACEICRSYDKKQQKETLMSHDPSERPWQKVGTDLFEIHGMDYLVTVDYYSNFFEVDRLYTTTSTAVINKLKSHFARYGIPDVIVSDNGPQYSSREFAEFTSAWDIEHTPSSPGHSQSNGKAESAVKTAKRLMMKASDSKSSPYLALLDHRNTPTEGLGSSPVQRLMSRRTKTLLPTSSALLYPETLDRHDTQVKMKSRLDKQATYYNKGAKDLYPLHAGDKVHMQPFILGKKEWKSGIVKKRLDERSYEVSTPTGIYRRNRVHIRKDPVQNHTRQVSPPRKPNEDAVPKSPVQSQPTNVEKTDYGHLVTRSGRKYSH